MRTNVKIIATIVIFVTAVALLTIAIMSIADNPPIDGYITGKSCHPAYYPAFPGTPTVYCLGITSHDGKIGVAWKVSEEVYYSYNVGDLTGMPTNLK